MAKLINIPTFSDARGNLSVVDEIVPFDIKRVYYIYQAVGLRGGHRHKKTIQGLIAVSGSCDIFIDNGQKTETIKLETPNKLLVVSPEDWHTMQNFSSDCVLLVLSSEHYDRNDYIDQPYK